MLIASLNYPRLAFACCRFAAWSNFRGGIRKLVGEASNDAMVRMQFCRENSPNGLLRPCRDSPQGLEGLNHSESKAFTATTAGGEIIWFPFCSLNEKQQSIPNAPLQMAKHEELPRCETGVSGHY